MRAHLPDVSEIPPPTPPSTWLHRVAVRVRHVCYVVRRIAGLSTVIVCDDVSTYPQSLFRAHTSSHASFVSMHAWCKKKNRYLKVSSGI